MPRSTPSRRQGQWPPVTPDLPTTQSQPTPLPSQRDAQQPSTASRESETFYYHSIPRSTVSGRQRRPSGSQACSPRRPEASTGHRARVAGAFRDASNHLRNLALSGLDRTRRLRAGRPPSSENVESSEPGLDATSTLPPVLHSPTGDQNHERRGSAPTSNLRHPHILRPSISLASLSPFDRLGGLVRRRSSINASPAAGSSSRPAATPIFPARNPLQLSMADTGTPRIPIDEYLLHPSKDTQSSKQSINRSLSNISRLTPSTRDNLADVRERVRTWLHNARDSLPPPTEPSLCTSSSDSRSASFPEAPYDRTGLPRGYRGQRRVLRVCNLPDGERLSTSSSESGHADEPAQSEPRRSVHEQPTGRVRWSVPMCSPRRRRSRSLSRGPPIWNGPYPFPEGITPIPNGLVADPARRRPRPQNPERFTWSKTELDVNERTQALYARLARFNARLDREEEEEEACARAEAAVGIGPHGTFQNMTPYNEQNSKGKGPARHGFQGCNDGDSFPQLEAAFTGECSHNRNPSLSPLRVPAREPRRRKQMGWRFSPWPGPDGEPVFLPRSSDFALMASPDVIAAGEAREAADEEARVANLAARMRRVERLRRGAQPADEAWSDPTESGDERPRGRQRTRRGGRASASGPLRTVPTKTPRFDLLG